MNRFVYYIFRFLIAWFAITPFFILYVISDISYLIVFFLIGYRKKVVYENLKSSFPDKEDSEIRRIRRRFFRHLCDISIETIKGFSLSKKQLKKRYTVLNPEITLPYFEQNKPVICLASHYNNWEYGILALGPALSHQAVSIYMKLSNPYMEDFGTRIRARFGMKMLAVNDTREYFSQHHEKPLAIILAADQSPSNVDKLIWTQFLGKETACLHGPEAYAKKMNAPLIYFAVKKIKRGYYSLNLELLHENPSETAFGEITSLYMQRLEKDIITRPEHWLWSHRRWKHRKEDIEANPAHK
ncbi:MAG TPA: lysophospholipid acyltransferase family protein [Bacteroidales bacterium]|nr:lysophospholipid acyltransferase family protein [Bacteroidales bacterium]HOE04608.1 lysophospholipid acyltransferase family protein [Bacteroidales bacterium]